MEPLEKSDEVMKLLDRGYTVVLRACGLGSYFAVAVRPGTEAETVLGDAIDRTVGWDGTYEDDEETEKTFGEAMEGVTETDDFTPAKALYRLTEKATTGRIVGCDPEKRE